MTILGVAHGFATSLTLSETEISTRFPTFRIRGSVWKEASRGLVKSLAAAGLCWLGTFYHLFAGNGLTETNDSLRGLA